MLESLKELLEVFKQENPYLHPLAKVGMEVAVLDNDDFVCHSHKCRKNWLEQKLEILSNELEQVTDFDCTIKICTSKNAGASCKVMVRNGSFYIDGQGVEFEHCNYALS